MPGDDPHRTRHNQPRPRVLPGPGSGPSQADVVLVALAKHLGPFKLTAAQVATPIEGRVQVAVQENGDFEFRFEAGRFGRPSA